MLGTNSFYPVTEENHLASNYVLWS